jgi:hypothetical protein
VREIKPRTALSRENWDAVLREIAGQDSLVSLDLSSCVAGDNSAAPFYRGVFRPNAGGREAAVKKIAALTLPEAAVKIENAKLYAFSALTRVRGENVREIAPKTFKLCSALENVDLPNVELVGAFAFEMCFSFTRASFPRAQKIGAHAFERCWALETLVLGQKIPSLGAECFKNTRRSGSTLTISVPFSQLNSFLAAWGHADAASETALFGANHKTIAIEAASA